MDDLVSSTQNLNLSTSKTYSRKELPAHLFIKQRKPPGPKNNFLNERYFYVPDKPISLPQHEKENILEKKEFETIGEFKKPNPEIRELNSKSNYHVGFEGLKFTLKPHQEKGVAWMIEKERNDLKGGVLADDMGLGKTIQTIALILLRKEKGQKATLIICPVGLLLQWKEEFSKFAPELVVNKYHGEKKIEDEKEWNNVDIVLKNEFKKYSASKYQKKESASPLFEYDWYRIVLDEGHIIKNPATKTYLATINLRSVHRWCLTGTPIQNESLDFFALLNFVKNSKFSIQSSKGNNPDDIRKSIDRYLLRREKEAVLLDLPAIEMHLKSNPFLKEELSLYSKIEAHYAKTLVPHKNKGEDARTVLAVILKLRQFCDHPFLINTDSAKKDCQIKSVTDADELAEQLDTLTFKEKKKSVVIQDAEILKLLAQWPIEKASTKIVMMLDVLYTILSEDPKRKVIVYSQFTSMLDVIQHALKDSDYTYRRYDGKMRTTREASLEQFRKNPSIQVLIMSLQCGSVGLNIIEASAVIFVDQWWNPTVEWQAIGRVHRIGQEKKVDVYRLVIKNSFEERILQLQEKKARMIENTLGKTSNKKLIVTEANMIDLFLYGSRLNGAIKLE